MKDTRSIEIKVGLVSILAVILFIIGITLGRGLYVSVNPVTVKIRFPNSGNIQISAPVFVNGVKRGAVASVRNDNGSVLVTADLDNVREFRREQRRFTKRSPKENKCGFFRDRKESG